MKQTFRDRIRQRICVSFERIITQAKELKQSIDQKGLRKFEGRGIKSSNLYSQELVDITFIGELKVFRAIVHRLNKAIN
jgi:hypothetical protein